MKNLYKVTCISDLGYESVELYVADSTDTFEKAFDEISGIYNFIIKRYKKRLKSDLNIGDDFITSILKIE